MENSAVAGGSPEASGAVSTGDGSAMTRKEKRKILKKLKRKQLRRDMAIREKEEEEARLNDPEEQLRLKKMEEEERERSERERRLFEERERLWIEAKKKEEEEAERQRKLLEEANKDEKNREENLEKSDGDDGEWEYVEAGPAEIIWKGNEIIVKKKKIKVPKANAQKGPKKEDAERPTSNPLPPQSEAFSSHSSVATVPAQELLNKMAQETPNFGTEQDKAHCPFHLKTGVCRFGLRCNRAHFYPEKSCTLLMKNMYVGPGLAWELDEGLECTDEEVEHSYEEFYEDVHTEFLKFGELVNFKVCRNSSYHLRGNVYVHYKSFDSAVFAYGSINGRYFAGKQITCEFVSVTRWKVAICGEYMKSRLKSCSRGSTCNFLHCFRNPGGDYEWADWDKPPPKYWINKMVSLFGFSDQSYYDNKAVELGDVERQRNSDWRRTPTSDRYDSRRKKESRDRDSLRDDSDLERENRKRKRDSSRFEKQPTRDSDRHHSTRERYDERLESSSHKHKERSNKEYHKEDSTKNKTESKKRHRYKEAKEVSEESYSEAETDGRREESKRRWDKCSDDLSYDERLESSSHKHKERSNREYHKKDSTKNKTESKRRQRYNEAKDVSEESYSEEETDGRREESKRRRDKYSDDLSDIESRKHHSSKKRSHRRKHQDDDIEEENYENSDSSLRKHGRAGEGREHRKKGEERGI
ncbi:zinc finger CCCH domain-containing protein 5 [Carex littledalei]|uniref:Zinc finger CCCH domain-containing protein 5 n=1 Tax=Carex littledalei TaxID=544730 RepID=A0A833VYS6_9POAL|nr:zinc finger CCCH domain-containing protein 5 [Carex littledalei]